MTVPDEVFSCCCDWGYQVRGLELIPDCLGCPEGMVKCWELTVAGITDNLCTLCDNANGTFILEYVGFCSFWSPTFSAQFISSGDCFTSTSYRWDLTYFSGGLGGTRWLIRLVGGSVLATWTSAVTFDGTPPPGWNCKGSNTLDFVSTAAPGISAPNPACTNYPATLTITPAFC